MFYSGSSFLVKCVKSRLDTIFHFSLTSVTKCSVINGGDYSSRLGIGLLAGEVITVDYAQQVKMLVSALADQTGGFIAQLEGLKVRV